MFIVGMVWGGVQRKRRHASAPTGTVEERGEGEHYRGASRIRNSHPPPEPYAPPRAPLGP